VQRAGGIELVPCYLCRGASSGTHLVVNKVPFMQDARQGYERKVLSFWR